MRVSGGGDVARVAGPASRRPWRGHLAVRRAHAPALSVGAGDFEGRSTGTAPVRAPALRDTPRADRSALCPESASPARTRGGSTRPNEEGQAVPSSPSSPFHISSNAAREARSSFILRAVTLK